MRIIHAADLHLGRSFHERDLGPDQAHMLAALGEAVAVHEADILLLAGDIYDRAIPQPEAIALFDGFLTQAKAARPDLVVVAVPGNHDSATRLSFGADLLSRAGLHLRTRPEEVVEPILVERRSERCAIWALPYLNPGAFARRRGAASEVASEAASDASAGAGAQGELFAETAPAPAGLRSQGELFAEAMDRVRPRLVPGARNVLVAHCFATGCVSSESERAFVGAAEEVPISLLEPFDYVALGHLHRRQAAGPRARYPGSPLAYSFAEAEAAPQKGFLLIELEASAGSGAAAFTETFIELSPLHRARRLEGPFAELSAPGAYREFRDDFLDIRLTDPDPVLDPSDPLRANFPNLLSVRQAAFELAAQGRGGRVEPRQRGAEEGEGAVLEDFRAFHEEMKGAAPDPQTEEAFLLLLKEASHAAD